MALEVVHVYPAADESGLPLLTDITVEFSEAIDIDSINSGTYVVATLAKNVVMTGPMIHNWAALRLGDSIDALPDTLLESPTFNGLINGNFTFSDDLKTVSFRPSSPLNPNVNHITILSQGILTRTIGPVVQNSYGPNPGTGFIELIGPYTGGINNDIIIRIQSPGSLGNATFVYWFTSDPLSISAELSTDRLIRLDNGILVKFSEGTYQAADTFSAWLKPGIPLENLYSWGWSTGDGSLVEPPTEIKSVNLEGATVTGLSAGNFEVSGSAYYIGSTIITIGEDGDIPLNTTKFAFSFTSALDSTTVSTSTVKVFLTSLRTWNDRADAPASVSCTVTADGNKIIVQLSSADLEENQELMFTFNGIKASDGTQLADTIRYITTRLNPFYTTAERIQLEAGTYVSEVPKSTLKRLIHNYSAAVDAMNFRATPMTDTWYKFIASNYVVCSVIRDVMDIVIGATGGTMGKDKTLGDLKVGWNNGRAGLSPKDFKDRAQKCSDTLQAALQNGGLPYVEPLTFVKGGEWYNRPVFGRGWLDPISSSFPFGNIRKIIFDRYYRTGKSIDGSDIPTIETDENV